jgi:NADH-quinone oxidoreductase subunit N
MQAAMSNIGVHAAAAEIFMLSAVCVVLLVDVFLSDRTRWRRHVRR